ncbi:RsmE family RNA methyltransferase [Candidatus Gracilibacteria bacterium]|nr:RsmE family RNA methyltransferase [Candidatus Gracilibacteria bacterium]
MQRFHFPTLNNQEIITISNNKDLFHQLTKVLRTKIGEEIIFFDGSNLYDYTYKIESIEKKSMSLKLTNKIQKSTKNQIALNLYQSLPNKQEKIELILQKGVEVGYTNFFFFKSERSQNLKLSENKIERFNKIVIEAVEQSGNNIIPEIHFLEKIDFRNIKGDNIYFHTDKTNAKKLKELDIKSKKANIFVGPEGGFTDNETINFDKIGFQKANLGDSILRTETTGIVVGFYLLQNI